MLNALKKLFGSNKKEMVTDFMSRGAIIIDVRSASEFNSGNIKSSKNMPLNTIPTQAEKIKKMNKPIIVCCASGMRSSQAKSILAHHGVEVMNGGSWLSLNNYINN